MENDKRRNNLEALEKRTEVKRFSEEQREGLRKEGYIFYLLTEQSKNSLVKKGLKLTSNHLDQFLGAIGSSISMNSEVAAKLEEFFIPDSNNKTLRQHEQMVGKLSEELGEKIPGVKAIIGQAIDYMELASINKGLFGKKNGFNFTRTATLINLHSICVGNFRKNIGLYVDHLDTKSDNGKNPKAYIAPLVVPV